MDGQKKYKVTKTALILRIVVSAYLLYTAWELRGAPAAHEGAESMIFVAAIVIFTLIGVGVGGYSLKAFLRGEYEQPGENGPDEKE